MASIKKIKYDKVVIGSTPEAIAYAKRHKIPVVLPNDEYPFEFDEHEGDPKIEIWSKGLWQLGLDGLNPFSGPVDRVAIDEDRIRITYDGTSLVDVEYEECFLFETENGVNHNLEILEKRDSVFRVMDWFAVDRCEKHSEVRIRTDDDFVKEIIFYQSDRVDGKHPFKDLVAVSYLTEEQLTKFEHSDTMAVFKVRHHLTENGIKGRISYYDGKGRPHRYKVRMRPTLRELEEISGNLYCASKKVHLCSDMRLGDILSGKVA